MAKKGIHLNLYRIPGPENVWRCDIKINRNSDGEGIMVSGTSSEDDEPMMGWGFSFKNVLKGLSHAGAALSKARQIGQAVLSNPVIANVIPYAKPALTALNALEVAEKHGLLGKLKKQLEDPTLRKVATELDEMSKGQRSAMSGGGVCLCDGHRGQHRGHHGHRGHGHHHGHHHRGAGGELPPAAAAAAAGLSLLGLDGTGLGAGVFPGNGKPSPFGLSAPPGPFGLPQGNPHPWAEFVRRQIAKGAASPLEAQKLARMWKYQRDMARASR